VISECHDVAERDRLMTTRRRFSSELKAKLAIEALKGQKTINEIASARRPPKPGGCVEEASVGRCCGAFRGQASQRGRVRRRSDGSAVPADRPVEGRA